MKHKFDASKLTATEWSTVKDKIKFAEQFVRFVESDYSPTQFPKWFYTRLSMCFGFIAHYNQRGFYETYFYKDSFGSMSNLQTFKDSVINYSCYGSPEFTYSDIESQIRAWYKTKLKDN